MDLGILVLGIIIIADLVAMYFVFRVGTRHDEHHNIRTADSSASVKELYRREEERQAKVAARDAALASQQQTNAEPAQKEEQPAEETNTVSDALGDEEARRKRREAALKRKAERQAQRAKASENE